MAGSPVRRMRRTVEQAAVALAEGRQDDARRALVELRRVAQEHGVAVPEMPGEVSELWVQISSAVAEPRRGTGARTTKMDDESRSALLESASLGAQRLLELMRDEGLWGPSGSMRPEVQINLIEKALRLGYGGMPAGAQVVTQREEDAAAERAPGDTLRMMIRAKQEPRLLSGIQRQEGDEDGEG